MRLLLDTSAFLWFIAGDEIPKRSRAAIVDPDNEHDLLLVTGDPLVREYPVKTLWQ